jgi:hypothetical protein
MYLSFILQNPCFLILDGTPQIAFKQQELQEVSFWSFQHDLRKRQTCTGTSGFDSRRDYAAQECSEVPCRPLILHVVARAVFVFCLCRLKTARKCRAGALESAAVM